jgi:hypothetical protein
MESTPSHTSFAAADHSFSRFGLGPEHNLEVLQRAREKDWFHLEPMLKNREFVKRRQNSTSALLHLWGSCQPFRNPR